MQNIKPENSMMARLSEWKSSVSAKWKRRHHGPEPKEGVSSSAATDALALSSPPSIQWENGHLQSQTVQSPCVPSQTVRPQRPQPEGVQPHNVQLQTAPAATSTVVRPGEGLWALAIDRVRKRESGLMLAYQEYLSLTQCDAAAEANLSDPEFIKSVVNKLMEDREKKKWHVSLLGKDIEVRKQVERLAKFLLWSDPIVKSAVSTQPYAALAWSGVSILLPLVTSSVTQNEAMLKGFCLIGDFQMYWRVVEETRLPSLDDSSCQHLIERLAQLYSYFIEYQARAICHLSKSQRSRAFDDISSHGEWDTSIQDIKDRHTRCREVVHLLDGDQIEKKWGEQLSAMQQSRDILEEVLNMLRESGMETRERHNDQKATALLQDLACDYRGHKNFNPRKVEGTCEWFFTDDRFRNWRDSDDSSLLWVSAGPGCGKSVLSRALIDEGRLPTNESTSTVCYFFFKDGDEGRMYAHNALCAILYQIFTHDFTNSLIERALPRHENLGKALTKAFSELWDILITCANSLDSGEIICLIDALDECQAESRRDLIQELRGLYQDPPKRPSRLKFFVTSRPYDDIELSFRQFENTATFLRFDGDDKSAEIGNEINLVIDARVDEFAQDFKEKDRLLIADRLKSMENRTYLWLHLTIDIIKESPSEYGRRDDVETLLSSLPSEISEAYEKILERSKSRRYTEAILQIMLAAERPLSLEEANYALVLAITEEKFDSHAALEKELWPSANFKGTVKNLCGLFISVYDEKLSFIHQTAREFLLSPVPQGKWKGRLTMPKSHSTLSLACLRYLLLPDLPAEGDVPTSGLLSYAGRYWPLHYKSQEVADASLAVKDARVVCSKPRAYAWGPYNLRENEDFWKSLSALSWACLLGLDHVVQDLLCDMTSNDTSEIDRALNSAAYNGHTEIVRMLLDHGADVNARSKFDETPLHNASRSGYTEIVQMLLDHGADVNALTVGKYTALYSASGYGHTEIVQMLLDHGADVNASRLAYQTPLLAASVQGHIKIVRMLLDHGAHVNVISTDGRSALQMATWRGQTEIVQLLLSAGATAQRNLNSALEAALGMGHTEIIEMLREKGAVEEASS